MRTHTGRAHQTREECPNCGMKGVGPFHTKDMTPPFRWRSCRYCTWTQKQDWVLNEDAYNFSGTWKDQPE